MFALGCVQARSCHTNKCPTGITTQDPVRQRALVVADKWKRVRNYHRNTVKALGEMLASAGLTHPSQIKPWHIHVRSTTGEVVRGDVAYPHVEPGALLTGQAEERLLREWKRASADSFQPQF
jgi:hypothetical protein